MQDVVHRFDGGGVVEVRLCSLIVWTLCVVVPRMILFLKYLASQSFNCAFVVAVVVVVVVVVVAVVCSPARGQT